MADNDDVHLVPLGEPRRLLHSPKFAQDLGVVVRRTDEDIQATVYGDDPNHARARSEKFVRLLEVGRIRLVEETIDE